jgi:DNA invertase Pin-like site-specific DNA recombinase
MIYGYIRVSTDRQSVENQRYEIEQFCIKNSIAIDRWIEETTSGTKTPDKRLLGTLLDSVAKNDLIICSELSRLGRSLFMIMSILNNLMSIGAFVWTTKDNYRLGDDLQSKVLAFAFAMSAEIERNLISQRTKEALARKKAEGVTLGRPTGHKLKNVKLTGYESQIRELLSKNISKSAIGRIFGVHRSTVDSFLKERMNGEFAQEKQ